MSDQDNEGGGSIFRVIPIMLGSVVLLLFPMMLLKELYLEPLKGINYIILISLWFGLSVLLSLSYWKLSNSV